MNQCNRIKTILQENKLKQRQFAIELGITESYISKLLKEPNIRLSQSLASLIEEKYGYNSEWILNGTEPKIKQISKNKSLSEIHQKALAQLEKMNIEQVKSVLAFIDSLDKIEKSFAAKVDKNIDEIKNQNEFLSIFNGLSPMFQEHLLKTGKDLLETQRKMEVTKKGPSDSIEPTSIEERVTQAEEEYIKSDSNLVRKRELLALNSTLDTQNINSGTTNDSINKNKAI